MQTHTEKKHRPHSQEQMLVVVSDIAKYPEFLPWCISTRILSREGNELQADMVIGYKVFREGFTSRVILTEPERIEVTYSRGPFKYLNNHWIFLPESDGTCTVDFYVEFEFRSNLMQKIIGLIFSEAVKKMVLSFEERAYLIYSTQQRP